MGKKTKEGFMSFNEKSIWATILFWLCSAVVLLAVTAAIGAGLQSVPQIGPVDDVTTNGSTLIGGGKPGDKGLNIVADIFTAMGMRLDVSVSGIDDIE